MRVSGRESEKSRTGTGCHEILERDLDVDPGGDRELASSGGDLAGRHAEMFEQRLAQPRPSKGSAADGKSKSHAALIVVSPTLAAHTGLAQMGAGDYGDRCGIA